MKLQQLHYFEAIARLRSFTAAAAELHISQPSLSAQIRMLEDELRVELLIRHSRGITVTEGGRELVAQLQDVFSAMDRLKESMDAFRKPAPLRVTLGYTPLPGKVLVPELLGGSVARECQLNIQLREGRSDDLCRLVSSGEIDAAFCHDPPYGENFIVEPLYSEDYFLIGSPHTMDLCGEEIPFARLKDFRLVLDRRNYGSRRKFQEIAWTKGIDLHIRTVPEIADVQRAITSERGLCTVSPYGLFCDDILAGTVAARRVIEPIVNRTMMLAFNRACPKEMTSVLVSRIRHVTSRHIVSGEFGWHSVAR